MITKDTKELVMSTSKRITVIEYEDFELEFHTNLSFEEKLNLIETVVTNIKKFDEFYMSRSPLYQRAALEAIYLHKHSNFAEVFDLEGDEADLEETHRLSEALNWRIRLSKSNRQVEYMLQDIEHSIGQRISIENRMLIENIASQPMREAVAAVKKIIDTV